MSKNTFDQCHAESFAKVIDAVTGQYPAVVVKESLASELTLEVPIGQWLVVAKWLVIQRDCRFEQLTDCSAVDYLQYGLGEWATDADASASLSRAREIKNDPSTQQPHRFAMVYHLLSIALNQRVRVRVWLPNEEPPCIDSVVGIWPVANWYEREAFDLFGIQFKNHPDCRRLLTDYGFQGHPMRKDFPVSGHVELRYDATTERCVYEDVTVVPRVTVPKVIRDDSRYEEGVVDE